MNVGGNANAGQWGEVKIPEINCVVSGDYYEEDEDDDNDVIDYGDQDDNALEQINNFTNVEAEAGAGGEYGGDVNVGLSGRNDYNRNQGNANSGFGVNLGGNAGGNSGMGGGASAGLNINPSLGINANAGGKSGGGFGGFGFSGGFGN